MDYASIISSKLRKPGRASEPSVMTRPAEPEWQPEYVHEPPLESVSPEDWIPNPKTVITSLKGLPALAGVMHRMDPKEFLRVAAPFGHQGGRKMDPKSVAYHVENPGVPGAYLSLKDTENGLQVASHDGRHRALAALQTGRPFEVDIRRSKRMERETPDVTEEELLSRMLRQGSLLPEY